MRVTVSFLIGCVLGATAVLMWVEETGAREESGGRVGSSAQATALPTAARPDSRVPSGLTAGSLLLPVANFPIETLKSEFDDPRSGGRLHRALDLRAPRGTPVLAVTDGVIKKLFTSKAGGLTIYHYDKAEEICYYYAHLDRYADDLREGMKVARGTVIGYVGTTGNAPPDTPHLHFAVTRLPPTKEWWKGEAVDPYPLLTGR